MLGHHRPASKTSLRWWLAFSAIWILFPHIKKLNPLWQSSLDPLKTSLRWWLAFSAIWILFPHIKKLNPLWQSSLDPLMAMRFYVTKFDTSPVECERAIEMLQANVTPSTIGKQFRCHVRTIECLRNYFRQTVCTQDGPVLRRDVKIDTSGCLICTIDFVW